MSENQRDTGRRSADYQTAVERLEVAVQDLVHTAKDEISDRATNFIEETTSRLEREFGERRSSVERGRRRQRGRGRGHRRRRATVIRQRTRRLYRDPKNGRIAGVCAGIANYYGTEVWVVRCIAVTGLLFMGSIVFPAYWVAYFVMDNPPKHHEAERMAEDRDNHTSPAPEFGPKFSPRRSLRNVQADLNEAELRIRRMESHVTSGQYELQKELHKIDDGKPGEST